MLPSILASYFLDLERCATHIILELMGEEGDLSMIMVRFMHFGSANVVSIKTPLFCGSCAARTPRGGCALQHQLGGRGLFDGCHARPRVKVEVAVPQRVFHVCVLPKSHYQSTPCQF